MLVLAMRIPTLVVAAALAAATIPARAQSGSASSCETLERTTADVMRVAKTFPRIKR